jgi:hypothetical protein
MRNHWLDNRWVVPYNPKLLMCYNCHINVETCCNIKSIKYIYKYIYKGHDNASFSIEVGTTDGPIAINEVKQYRKSKMYYCNRGILPSTDYIAFHLLTDKRRIHLRSASVRTYTFFTTGFPRFLSIHGARGLQAFDLPLLTNYSKPNYD